MEIKIGDEVIVTKPGQIYSSYKSMFQKHRFKNNSVNKGQEGDIGVVRALDKHNDGTDLCALDLNDGRQLLIGVKGVEILSFKRQQETGYIL